MIKEEILKLIDNTAEIQIQISSRRIEILQEISEVVKTVKESDTEKMVITYALTTAMEKSAQEELDKITKYQIQMSKLKMKMGL